MENNQNITPEQALQVLAKAAELYVAGLDDLAKTFSLPNLQMAVYVLQNVIQAQAAMSVEAKDA